jgi:hypothetical protein
MCGQKNMVPPMVEGGWGSRNPKRELLKSKCKWYVQKHIEQFENSCREKITGHRRNNRPSSHSTTNVDTDTGRAETRNKQPTT